VVRNNWNLITISYKYNNDVPVSAPAKSFTVCSKIKLTLSINGHKQLLTHTETRNGKKIGGDGSYPSTKVPDILQ